MTALLFIYGTLLQPGNPFANYLNSNCSYVCAGKIKGLLYDIGEYPGLIINTHAEGFVLGSVVKLHQPAEGLKVIDDYEGVGPEQDQPNLYLRTIQTIITAKGPADAWVYIYNLPVAGLPVIASGNYQEFAAHKTAP
ncbi:gamma-glutamylcyclotransferase family protein [Mucilaginibacter phyllosphaerae]|uniref:Gamma-glutamylcyclotransferase n=1 Tax=Mucilaginibacter phyllosphaerae TaxID=1812349 RepID=A0A4Y8AJZ0_9SPHI|nr:gamma-glutamylcyclotransferase family protein [Mucilaginibacter phyllosphaerae]MBB3968166.1 gamma-glutamylcyclotransferase (GGCT)/AIG2-like uncharacterized protein YtfP [Mucilaginibacter phyllosphaerae]TEW68819.1 gamma-glutamylcyclotransferase [Mucilaginibacter phyllosphaerae]GGH00800.1 hypothetical protein GCM10007352_02240 [Mucilaginibacter phyllosphaerae]